MCWVNLKLGRVPSRALTNADTAGKTAIHELYIKYRTWVRVRQLPMHQHHTSRNPPIPSPLSHSQIRLPCNIDHRESSTMIIPISTLWYTSSVLSKIHRYKTSKFEVFNDERTPRLSEIILEKNIPCFRRLRWPNPSFFLVARRLLLDLLSIWLCFPGLNGRSSPFFFGAD